MIMLKRETIDLREVYYFGHWLILIGVSQDMPVVCKVGFKQDFIAD